MSSILQLLRASLEEGACCIGQVIVHPDYRLHHAEDADVADNLQIFSRPEDAIEIAKYDDGGNYRPLKTAPNLKRGWILRLAGLEEVRQALDFLYPAALGLWHSSQKQRLHPTALRLTLARQTGMYAVVKKITDEEIDHLIGQVCNFEKGCLRQILWPVSEGEAPARSDIKSCEQKRDNIPLFCSEACNLFIAEGRKMVKGRPASD